MSIASLCNVLLQRLYILTHKRHESDSESFMKTVGLSSKEALQPGLKAASITMADFLGLKMS